jgi:hypothetical protein
VSGALTQHYVWILSAAFCLLAYRRISAAHFKTANNLIAMLFGPPIFVYLLRRSKMAHKNGQVSWKGRAYNVASTSERKPTRQAAKPIPAIESKKLRTEN